MPIININLTPNQRKKLLKASESSETVCFRIDKNNMTGAIPITVDEETARKYEIALKNGRGMKLSPQEISAGTLDSSVLHTDPDPKDAEPIKKKTQRIKVSAGKKVKEMPSMQDLLQALPKTEEEETIDQAL